MNNINKENAIEFMKQLVKLIKMIEKEKITQAKELMKEIVELQDSYDKLNEPNAHLNICTLIENKPASTPLCDTITPDVQKMIEIRMNERWNSLRKLFD